MLCYESLWGLKQKCANGSDYILQTSLLQDSDISSNFFLILSAESTVLTKLNKIHKNIGFDRKLHFCSLIQSKCN